MNKTFKVYIHISPSWKYYVGMTSAKKVEDRWGKEGNGYKTQYFKRAIDKYGWDNFIHIVVRDNLTKEDASCLEKLLIYKLKSNDNKYGYNISIGGGRTTLGYHHSKAAREAIANHLSFPVKQYDKQGNLIHEWNSIRGATKELGYDESSIAKCCKGIYKTSYNFVWRYKEDDFNKYDLKNPNKNIKLRKKVKQFDCDGNLIRIWNSISEISRKLNLSSSSISGCCKGEKGRKTVNGFVWRYLEDAFNKYDLSNAKYSPVCQYDLNKKLIAQFNTIHDAVNATNISSGNIISCCKGITSKAGGFIWKYKNVNED